MMIKLFHKRKGFFLLAHDLFFFSFFPLIVSFIYLISQISDIRERYYEKIGIGSSYLFRLDDGYVVSIK